MPISITDTFSGPYHPDGIVTVFPFAFTAFASDGEMEVRVIRVAADGTETAIDPGGYSVASSVSGGSVLFAAAPPAGDPLYILSSPNFRQDIGIANQSAFLPTIINEALDRAATRDLHLKDHATRAPAFPIGETAPGLPSLAVLEGKSLALIDGRFVPVASDVAGVTADRLAVEAMRNEVDADRADVEGRQADVIGRQSGAQQSATIALNAAERANTAALSAAITTPIYPDEATGRAAVADGAYFRAIGATSAQAIDIWRRDGSSASTLIRSYPSAGAVLDAVAEAEAAAIAAATAASILVGPPPVPPAPFSRTFGQDSANWVTGSPITQGRYTTPTGALNFQPAGTDWVQWGWFAAGGVSTSAQSETYASNGGPQATGGGDRVLRLMEGSGGYGINLIQRQNSSDLMPNPVTTPAGRQYRFYVPIFWMQCQVGDRCYFSWAHLDDAAIVHRTCDGNHTPFSFYGGGGITVGSATSASRTANVVTINRNGHGRAVGSPIWLMDTNELTFVRADSTTSVIKVDSAGPDGPLASHDYRIQGTIGAMWTTFGAASDPQNADHYGFGGRIGGYAYRRGAIGIRGDLSALIDGDTGKIDETLFRKLANRRIAHDDLPGTNVYSFDDPEGAVTGERAGLGGLVKTGVSFIAQPLLQPDFLRLDPRPRFPHANLPGKDGGHIEVTGTCSVGIRCIRGILYRYDGSSGFDPATAPVAIPDFVAAYPQGRDNGRFYVKVPFAPDDADYILKLYSEDNPHLYVLDGPHDIGDVYWLNSQSTLGAWASSATGNGIPPPSTETGAGYTFFAGLSDPPVVNASNSKEYFRTRARPFRVTGAAANGMAAIFAKAIALRAADPRRNGRKAVVGLVWAFRNGHQRETYFMDRRVYRNAIGTVAAGVAKTGAWSPVASGRISTGTPIYTLAGSAKLLINGRIAARTDASGHWEGNGVSGTFNHSTGSYAITSQYPGTAEIEAEMEFRTQSGSTSERDANGFSVFGSEEDPGVSGYILEMIRRTGAMGRVTYVVTAWLNYLVNYIDGLPEAPALAYLAHLDEQQRARFLGVEIDAGMSWGVRNPFITADGGKVPWVLMNDPRTTGFSNANEERARLLAITQAVAIGDPVIPGPITYEVDANSSPHAGPGPAGAQLGGETLAHGLQWLNGIAGAVGEYLTLAGVARIDAGRIRLFFQQSRDFPSSGLTTGAGGAPQAIFLGTTAANMSRIDPAAYSITIDGLTVDIERSGGIPSGVVAVNVGAVIGSEAGTNAAQNSLLADALTYDMGGFTSAARKGASPQSLAPLAFV